MEVRMPAVGVAPGELERNDVADDAETPFQPLPGRTGCDLLPGRTFGGDESGERVGEGVRNGDGDQAGAVALRVPGGEGVAEFVGATVVDLGRADGAEPDIAAGFQTAVVSGAVPNTDLHPVADRDSPAG